jgi:uracil permease
MKSEYLYDIDDRLPLQYAVLYGLQWAFIMFPVIIIAANLGVGAFNPGLVDGIRFLQLSLLTSGVFTVIQTLWGHHYPLLEGPSTALILSFILLAPGGLPEIQGGMIIAVLFLQRQHQRLMRLFTLTWSASS